MDALPAEVYTLSLHDALPISVGAGVARRDPDQDVVRGRLRVVGGDLPVPAAFKDARVEQLKLGDRKSTRLNSSHRCISYAVFCLKKKKSVVIGDTVIKSVISA